MIYFYTIATVVVFLLLKKLLAPIRSPLANPLLWSIAFFMLLFSLSHLNFQHYQDANQLFIWLLEPAVVALALPLFNQVTQIRNQLKPILISCSIGVIVAMSSGLAIAYAFTSDKQLLLSLLPKSVTSPIAMAIAQQTGGLASLSAAVVIAVGLLGALCGFSVLKWAKITNLQAQGIAMGCSAHAIGTAKAIETGKEQGAFSSLALVISGILTAVLAPIFAMIIQSL